MPEYTLEKGYTVGIQGELKSQWLQKILETLKFVIDFCDKNNIRYYGCAGTVIGAIRHNGMIPWDDDIDLMMPRRDYEIFIKKFSEIKNSQYSLVVPEIESDYYLMFAKVFFNGSTLLERKDLKYLIGPFVDIFPVDGCPDDDTLTNKLFVKYHKYCGYWSTATTYWDNKEYKKCISSFRFKHIVKHIFFHIFKRSIKKIMLSKTKQIESLYDYDTSNKVITWCGQNRIGKEIHQKEWMGRGTKVKFEDIMLNIPTNYDAYLKCMYGDYMKLPPKEDQVSHHYVAYLNMDKRESLKEVMNKIEK